MAKFGGVALKSLALFLRFIQFASAAIILGIFCYFLAILTNHDLFVSTYIRAVTGISGAAVVYSILAILLVCFLGGKPFFSFIAMILDVAFTGAFIYIAWASRGGASSCSGDVATPFGNGNTQSANEVPSRNGGSTILPSFRTACKLQTAAFSLAIIGCFFFFISIPIEFALIKHHKKEKAFGPGPSNNYTAGSPKRKFWQRKPKQTTSAFADGDKLPTHTTPNDMRTSYATDNTAVAGHELNTQPQVYNKYAEPAVPGATNHADGTAYKPYRASGANF